MCKKIGPKLFFFVLLHHFYAFSSQSSQFADIYLASNETISCDYYSTINITDGSLQIDKSWLHDGLHYGIGLYAKYNYVLSEDGNKTFVPDHIRGCICLLKPCIYACCESHKMTDNFTGNCASEEFDQLWWDVGLEGEELERREVSKTFQWMYRRPTCQDKHFLDPDQYDFDKWYLAEVSCFHCNMILDKSSTKMLFIERFKKKTKIQSQVEDNTFILF